MGKVLKGTLIPGLLTALLNVSCNNGECTELRSAVPRADFYSMSTKTQVTVDSLEITGIGAMGDSILYGPSSRVSTVYLPMPALEDKVRWRIAYMQKALAEYGVADTITMEYTRTPWFAGEECGAMYKYTITKMAYTRNVVDSVALVDSVVVNVDKANLAVYFRTSDD